MFSLCSMVRCSLFNNYCLHTTCPHLNIIMSAHSKRVNVVGLSVIHKYTPDHQKQKDVRDELSSFQSLINDCCLAVVSEVASVCGPLPVLLRNCTVDQLKKNNTHTHRVRTLKSVWIEGELQPILKHSCVAHTTPDLSVPEHTAFLCSALSEIRAT